MPVIGVIDDREDLRHILNTTLHAVLPAEWQSVESDPLPSLNNYPSWITENKIAALIVDERLGERAVGGEGHVDYNGHDLAQYLRARPNTLPIFIVTSNTGDEGLEERFSDVEDIIDRDEFLKKAEDYVPRIVRSSQKYLETFQNELAELSDFAQKAASNEEPTEEEKKRAKAIQTKIETAFSVDEISNRKDWLDELDKKVVQLEELKSEIEDHIKKPSE
jgi:CheY-like chemotaxis protein